MEKITSVIVAPGFEDLDKINEIYTDAFPPEERKFTIQQMLESPVLKPDVRAYYCDGKIIGMSVLSDFETFVYGLFIAINKAERCNGYGGKILDKIIEDCADKPFVFSIEDPSEDCDNKEQRIRREAFYLKHNCNYADYKASYPGSNTCFRLMCSDKLADYSFIKDAVTKINPTLASLLERC